MRAVSETTSARVVTTLEAVKMAVGGAEASRRYERRQVCHGAFADLARQCRVAHRRDEAAAAMPASQRGDVSVCCVERRKSERSPKRVRFREKRILHEKTLHSACGTELIRAALAAHRVVDRKRDGDRRRFGPGVRHTITKD